MVPSAMADAPKPEPQIDKFRDPAQPVSAEVRSFVDTWISDNAAVFDGMLEAEAQRPGSRYAAAIRACLDAIDTERRSDA
jgi:hypothetical protein